MNRAEVRTIVLEEVRRMNDNYNCNIPLAGDDTHLYNREGYLDSLGLVTFLVLVEERLSQTGFRINLMDETLMLESTNPFESVGSLVKFIVDTYSTTGSGWIL